MSSSGEPVVVPDEPEPGGAESGPDPLHRTGTATPTPVMASAADVMRTRLLVMRGCSSFAVSAASASGTDAVGGGPPPAVAEGLGGRVWAPERRGFRSS